MMERSSKILGKAKRKIKEVVGLPREIERVRPHQKGQSSPW